MITRIRSLFQHNLPIKIMSLIIATVMWVYVMDEKNPMIYSNYSVRLETVNAPEGYVVNLEQEKVKLRVRGKRGVFATLSDSDFGAYVDLSKAEDGNNKIKVVVVLPPGVELVEAKPEYVGVVLDEVENRQFKANVTASGKAAQGFIAGNFNHYPETVNVRGPKSVLDEVSTVLGYVNLNGHKENIDTTVKLKAYNNAGKEIQGLVILPDHVHVNVSVKQEAVKKTVSVRPNLDNAVTEGYNANITKVEPEQVEITGAEEKLANISNVSTEKINLSDLTAANGKRIFKLVLPDGVTADKKDVTVNVSLKKK